MPKRRAAASRHLCARRQRDCGVEPLFATSTWFCSRTCELLAAARDRQLTGAEVDELTREIGQLPDEERARAA